MNRLFALRSTAFRSRSLQAGRLRSQQKELLYVFTSQPMAESRDITRQAQLTLTRKAGTLILLFVFCLLPSFASRALAQTQTTGRIAGTVRDEHGALIVGAEVAVTSKTRGEARKVTTDAGSYSIPLLPPGAYRLSISANGFEPKVFPEIRVSLTETTTLDATLSVAGVMADPVFVAAAPLAQADGSQLGRVIGTRMVSELPLASRNFTQLLSLSTGTATALPDNTIIGRNTQNISVNGTRLTQNNFQINGIDANPGIGGRGQRLADPAPESIAEFKVQTSLYDATFGRAGGGQIQVVTKSGSNDFHGALYEYFSNDALNANNPFLRAAGRRRPVLKRNYFGFTTGGPVRRDRIFFFASYQGIRERNGISNSISSNVLIAEGLTDERSEQTLLRTFRPTLPNGLPATAINAVALGSLTRVQHAASF